MPSSSVLNFLIEFCHAHSLLLNIFIEINNCILSLSILVGNTCILP